MATSFPSLSTIYPDNNSSISLDDCGQYQKFSQEINNRYRCQRQDKNKHPNKNNKNNCEPKINEMIVKSNFTDLLPTTRPSSPKPTLEMIEVILIQKFF